MILLWEYLAAAKLNVAESPYNRTYNSAWAATNNLANLSQRWVKLLLKTYELFSYFEASSR